MKQLIVPPSDVPFSQRHKDVVRSKTNTVNGIRNETKFNLLNLENQILARYAIFERAVAQKDLFNLSEDLVLARHRSDLLSCYTGRTNKVKEIFSLIENAQPSRLLKRCPYCGITLPKTFDHYLPESKFPELSVHALNLVPCCGTCNQTKNNDWKNFNHRFFLHFYSDEIPELQYLNVNLHTRDGVNAIGATFSINRPEGISDDIWVVLTSHYTKLNLITTYNELANDEISEVFNTCLSHLRCGGTNVSRFIEHLLLSEEQLYGLNHWRVVLMKALSANNNFSTAINTVFQA